MHPLFDSGGCIYSPGAVYTETDFSCGEDEFLYKATNNDFTRRLNISTELPCTAAFLGNIQ